MKIPVLLWSLIFFLRDISPLHFEPASHTKVCLIPLFQPMAETLASAEQITLKTGRRVSLKSFNEAMSLLYHAEPFEKECLHEVLVEGKKPCFPHNDFYKIIMEAINRDHDVYFTMKASLIKKSYLQRPYENIGTSRSTGGIIGHVEVIDPTGRWH